MSTTAPSMSPEAMQQAARDHLWLHFTRMGGYAQAEVPVIVRGDGCYLEDANGKRYLDALAGLFSVNIGYGFGEEIGEAAAAQMRELPFYTNWSYAHPRAIELAQEIASLAPGDLNRVFFVSGGSEAVESAWKLARQYYVARHEQRVRAITTTVPTVSGEPEVAHVAIAAAAQRVRAVPTTVPSVPGEPEVAHDAIVAAAQLPKPRYKAIARHIAYHGTTFGALSINGIPALRIPFEPLVPEVRHVHNTNRYHRPPEETEEGFTRFLLDDLEQTILAMGPETVCLVHMEPVQNAGGAFTPPAGYWQGVRELCDRYDILLSADEVITGFGRLGYWFGSERYDIRPDIVCSAKGLSSSYGAIGAVIATDRVMEPFLEATSMYSHGITFGGHPVMCAIALKNIEIMKRERIVEGVREQEEAFRSTLAQLLELPIVGDVRGCGYFYAVELVKDKETRETFTDDECETLLRGFLSGELFRRGLICRADDRGDPVIQISPPLVARQAQFDEMVGILGDVLEEAGNLMRT
jgi:adenosylmethionine-8-amino-7-oxononanoate aminotransferase